MDRVSGALPRVMDAGRVLEDRFPFKVCHRSRGKDLPIANKSIWQSSIVLLTASCGERLFLTGLWAKVNVAKPTNHRFSHKIVV